MSSATLNPEQLIEETLYLAQEGPTIRFSRHAALQKRLNLQNTIDALADHRVHKRLYEAPGLYQDKRAIFAGWIMDLQLQYLSCHAKPAYLHRCLKRGMWIHPSAFSLYV